VNTIDSHLNCILGLQKIKGQGDMFVFFIEKQHLVFKPFWSWLPLPPYLFMLIYANVISKGFIPLQMD
jgi:hypothetical protein